MVGGAYNASVILCKSEDITGETPIEEDYYVAGLEFIEAALALLRVGGESGNGFSAQLVGVPIAEHRGKGLVGDQNGAVEIGLEDAGEISLEEEAVAFHALEQRGIRFPAVMNFAPFAEKAVPPGGGDDDEQDDAGEERVSPQPLVAQLECLKLVVLAQEFDLAFFLTGFEIGRKKL